MKKFIPFLLLSLIGHLAECQVIISEFLADPSPVVGLPEGEFVEIKNISGKDISLDGWILADRVTRGTLPEAILKADSLVILTSAEYRDSYSPFGKVLQVDPWPALNNGGDLLILRNQVGEQMDSLSYNLSWYNSSFKSKGGWSLERIDLTRKCNDFQNWTASMDPSGGSPGRQNSVNAIQPDLRPPEVVSAVALHATLIRVILDEKIEKSRLQISYAEEGYSSEVEECYLSETGDTLFISTQRELLEGKAYTLRLVGLRDCSGNTASVEVRFFLAGKAAEEDIKITEVLFDPLPGGEDFVEVQNISSKFLSLQGLIMRRWDDTRIVNEFVLREDIFLLPGEVIFMSRDPATVLSHYTLGEGIRSLQADVFNIPNDGGIFSLYMEYAFQDSIHLEKNFHHSLLQDSEGYSLERINPERPGWENASWMTSAARATPGQINTQHLGKEVEGEMVVLQPEVIRPLEQHQNSVQIRFNTGVTGVVGQVAVFSLDGYTVATILENELIPVSGYIRWDGTGLDGGVVPFGYYVVRCELIGPDGFRKLAKKRLIVAP
jgi:hypothetical protein